MPLAESAPLIHPHHRPHIGVHEATELPQLWLFRKSREYTHPLECGIPAGDGRPLLWVPGHTENAGTVSHLQTRFGEIGYDSRALDTTVHVIEAATGGYTQQIEEALANVDAPVTLIGHSAGGWAVSDYAAEHADRVAQVFLLGTPRHPWRQLPISHSIPVHDIRGFQDPIAAPAVPFHRSHHRRRVNRYTTHEGLLWHSKVFAYLGRHFQPELETR